MPFPPHRLRAPRQARLLSGGVGLAGMAGQTARSDLAEQEPPTDAHRRGDQAMPIYRRNGSDVWYIDVRTPGGKRIRQTTGTTDKPEAQELHDKLKHELWRFAKFGEKPSHAFDEAALRFLQESAGEPGYVNKALHIRHFRQHFAGRKLETLTRDEIFTALPTVNQRTREPRPVSKTTRNLYLSTIRVMLNTALKDWEWIERVPSLPAIPGNVKRIRWITREEAQRLLDAIASDWMRDVAMLGFATGLRQANLLGLEWSQVDLVKRRAWIHPDQAKARRPIGVPLNSEAVEVIRRQLGKHNTFVFVRKGEPIAKWDIGQWNRAVERAGIEHFRFHDVRHTWASWHVQGGTPLPRLMELGGWSKYENVLRYAHLAPDHLAPHAEAVTIWAQDGLASAGQGPAGRGNVEAVGEIVARSPEPLLRSA
ncbi:site-specific integrase [Paraburkholderia sp. CNPSo 3281]|uniref:tyrosine-type recombinase/integrase n=1 Tax=Paraburkholderia sp. CNPSo 3281 TaxID=2940933 RepID=UPI0020B74576|nr:site-specific integrase [Paraburkholderia sp. CNPSo 3281]MCP3714883.1 site-specific integrase [Paraburkholderia sp. CNPSo 3281]